MYSIWLSNSSPAWNPYLQGKTYSVSAWSPVTVRQVSLSKWKQVAQMFLRRGVSRATYLAGSSHRFWPPLALDSVLGAPVWCPGWCGKEIVMSAVGRKTNILLIIQQNLYMECHGNGFHLTSVRYINTWSSLISTRSTWLEPLSCEDKSLILHGQKKKGTPMDKGHTTTTHPPQRVWIWGKPREHFQIHYNHIGGELLSMISEKDMIDNCF